MASFLIGIIMLILGAAGLAAWRHELAVVLKGTLPPLLIIGGALTIFLGFDSLQARGRTREQDKGEKPPAC